MTKIGQGQDGPRCEVLSNESHEHRWGYLSSLHDAKLNQSRHDPGGVCNRDARELREGPEVQFMCGVCQGRKDSTLGVGDERLDGPCEVHLDILPYSAHE